MNAKIRLAMLAVAIAAGLAACSSSADDAAREQPRDALARSEPTGETSATANRDAPSGQSDEDAAREAAQTGQNAPSTAMPPESEPLSLIADIPDRDIRLYGAPDGVVLQIGEHEQAFEWGYMTPRGIMPVMHAADYDSDGEEELAINLHIGSGTGIAVDELHVVEFDETGRMEDHVFAKRDYTAQLDEQVRFRVVSRDSGVMGEIEIGTRTYHANLTSFTLEDYGDFLDRLFYGNIVRFEVTPQKVTAEFGVSVGFDQLAIPQYIGTLQADVEYREDGRFLLRIFAFEPDPAYRAS
jgi:hypothetical protein